MRDTQPIKTMPGKSVHVEMTQRLAAARVESRNAAIEEVITFLHAAGHADAAQALEKAAWPQTEASPDAPAT